MFGFVRLDKGLLTPAQRGFLNLAYCGLCRHLRKRYGTLAGLALSYDMLLPVLLVATQRTELNLLGQHTRCPAAGFLKEKATLGDEEALDYAGAMTMLLLDEKLNDIRRDGQRIPGYFAHCAARPYVDHARAILDSLDFPVGDIQDVRARQAQIEAAMRTQELAVHLNPTGVIVGQVLAHTARIAHTPENQAPLYALGQSIGSIVALADACEDLRTDRLRRAYNPLLDRASADPRAPLPISILRESCYAFAYEFQRMRECLADLSFARFPELIDNIISKGIPCRTKRSLYRLWADNHWEGDVPATSLLGDRFRRCPTCGKPHLPAQDARSRRAASEKGASNHKNLWLLGTLLHNAAETVSTLGFCDLKDYLVACALSTLV